MDNERKQKALEAMEAAFHLCVMIDDNDLTIEELQEVFELAITEGHELIVEGYLIGLQMMEKAIRLAYLWGPRRISRARHAFEQQQEGQGK